MDSSILTSTKKILGIDEAYDVFDLDVISHINSAFSVLTQLGVGPEEGFLIIDDSAEWDDFFGEAPSNAQVRTYIYLKVRMLFDPPTLSFLHEAALKQIAELEWRLNVSVDTLEVVE